MKTLYRNLGWINRKDTPAGEAATLLLVECEKVKRKWEESKKFVVESRQKNRFAAFPEKTLTGFELQQALSLERLLRHEYYKSLIVSKIKLVLMKLSITERWKRRKTKQTKTNKLK